MNGIQKGTAMWLIKYNLQGPSRKPVVADRLERPGKDNKKGRLTCYARVINWLPPMYDEDENVLRADQDVRLVVLGPSRDLVEYAYALNEKALMCGDMDPENKVMGIFLEGVDLLVAENVYLNWNDHHNSSLKALAHYAHSLRKMIPADRKNTPQVVTRVANRISTGTHSPRSRMEIK